MPVASASPARPGPTTEDWTGVFSRSCCWLPLASTKEVKHGKSRGNVQSACARDVNWGQLAIAAAKAIFNLMFFLVIRTLSSWGPHTSGAQPTKDGRSVAAEPGDRYPGPATAIRKAQNSCPSCGSVTAPGHLRPVPPPAKKRRDAMDSERIWVQALRAC